MNEQTAELIRAAIRYYADCLKVKTKLQDPLPIGFPLQIWFPEHRVAVEICTGNENRHRSLLKSGLAKNHEIALIKIHGPQQPPYRDDNCCSIWMEDLTEETLRETVRSIFLLIERKIDVDLTRDRNGIKSHMLQQESDFQL